MLFNSPVYIFLFFPCMALIYFMLNRRRFVTAGTVCLVLGSLFFYRYWNASYLQIILISIFINFSFGTMLHQTRKKNFSLRRHRITHKSVLILGIFFNIGLLGYYKYADFFLGNINGLLGTAYPLPLLALPLAISFFSFQQIAYLIDCSKENTKEHDFLNYCLFVSFFPQLIAGPIVHHQEMMPQFARLKNKVFQYPNIALGIFFFSMGLFKKVWVADQFSVWANTGFDSQTVLTLFDAWGTSLSYTFQLYFDFSGYADMAIGSALFFNIFLPVNFNSPYKSGSIREFWRRWHMTLSRWLRDYLYIPLGGNRKGQFLTFINLVITFLLAGLWHGAGWTFILWGGMHGVALVIHRVWNKFNLKIPSILGWLVTFLFVNASWVIFRATTLDDGFRILKGMVGANGISVNSKFIDIFHGTGQIQHYVEGLKGAPLSLPGEMYWYLLSFSLVLFVFPNSCQLGQLIKNPYKKNSDGIKSSHPVKVFRQNLMHSIGYFRPTAYWALFTGILFSMAVYRLLKVTPTQFLYFNF